MKLWQFVSEKDGCLRWALQREEGGDFEVIRRRSSRNFEKFCKGLLKGEKGVDKLVLKKGVRELPGTVVVPTQASKIVCVGLNYHQHAEEMGKAVPEEPLLFMKPVTALLVSGGEIVLPKASKEVHYEGELAVVIGTVLKGASEEEALAGILGYSCANDVTARDIQKREMRYTRGKGYDTFCPMGPALTLASTWEVEDQRLVTRVNGEQRQSSGLGDMIHSVGKLVSFISEIMTLLPGDVVLTGTPSGVGKLEHGDRVEVEIEGLGKLENTVV